MAWEDDKIEEPTINVEEKWYYKLGDNLILSKCIIKEITLKTVTISNEHNSFTDNVTYKKMDIEFVEKIEKV